MVVLKRRSRPVTFRVCTEEYEALTRACLAAGARSVSEFARTAVLERMQSMRAPGVALSGDLARLSRQLADLDLSLEEIRKRIREVLGSSYQANA